MGKDYYNRECYRNEQTKYSETATDNGKEDLLERGTRNMQRVLLLHHGFTTAFRSAQT